MAPPIPTATKPNANAQAVAPGQRPPVDGFSAQGAPGKTSRLNTLNNGLNLGQTMAGLIPGGGGGGGGGQSSGGVTGSFAQALSLAQAPLAILGSLGGLLGGGGSTGGAAGAGGSGGLLGKLGSLLGAGSLMGGLGSLLGGASKLPGFGPGSPLASMANKVSGSSNPAGMASAASSGGSSALQSGQSLLSGASGAAGLLQGLGGTLGKAGARFVPGLNIAMAGMDIASFAKTLKDPNASMGQKLTSGITAAGSALSATNIPGVSQIGAAVSTAASLLGPLAEKLTGGSKPQPGGMPAGFKPMHNV